MKKVLFVMLLAFICLVGCWKDKETEIVDNYILNSKKSGNIDTFIYFMDSAMKEVNIATKIKLNDNNTLLLIPAGDNKAHSCLFLESGGKSMLSDEWRYLYIGVTYLNYGYNYYAVAEDEADYGIDFFDRKTINNADYNLIYKGSKAKENGYRLLKEYYNKTGENIVYESNSSEFKELSSIIKLTNNENYNKIVIIGSKNCSYS